MKLHDILSWYNLHDRHNLFISNGKWTELLVPLKKCIGLRGFQVQYMTSEIVFFHKYLNSAFPTPRCPLK